MNKNKPAHEIRLSLVKATIWENHVGDVLRYNVTLSRSYKDGDEWKSTESFGRDDLLTLAKAIDRAHSWICDQRAAPKSNG